MIEQMAHSEHTVVSERLILGKGDHTILEVVWIAPAIACLIRLISITSSLGQSIPLPRRSLGKLTSSLLFIQKQRFQDVLSSRSKYNIKLQTDFFFNLEGEKNLISQHLIMYIEHIGREEESVG